MTSAKDFAQLVNGRIKQADRLTINASFAPLADGQQQLGSPLMLTAQTCALQDDGRMKWDSQPRSNAKLATLANSTHEPDS